MVFFNGVRPVSSMSMKYGFKSFEKARHFIENLTSERVEAKLEALKPDFDIVRKLERSLFDAANKPKISATQAAINELKRNSNVRHAGRKKN